MPNQDNSSTISTPLLSRNQFSFQSLFDPQPSLVTQSFLVLKRNLELNPTFNTTVQQKHNAVRSVLENLGIKNTKLIGSLQRRTRIQPLPGETFDIDILVPLGKFYSWVSSGGISPQLALEYLHGTLNESDRYSAMNPQQDQPTITFEYKDGIKVELVPAYLDMIGHGPDGKLHRPIGRGYWVVKNGKWVLAEYDHEADYITKANEDSDEWLIPVLKMLKAIKRIYFPKMSSIHLEILAALTIPSAVKKRKMLGFKISYPILITDFFLYAQPLLVSPIQIPGSNAAPHVFSVLEQSQIYEVFEIISNYCNNAGLLKTQKEKLAHWRTLFGDSFPTS